MNASARLTPRDLQSLPLDEVVALCASAPNDRDRRLARQFLDGVYEADVTSRSFRKCVALGHVGRRTCSRSCDRAFPSAVDCYRRVIDAAVEAQSIDAGQLINRKMNLVRDADVRRQWNAARGLIQRVQKADFAAGNLGRRCVESALSVVRSHGATEGSPSVSALSRLFDAIGERRTDGPMIELIGVTWSELLWFADRTYDDACDVANMGDIPFVDRLARRLCSDRGASDPKVLAVVTELVGPAFLLLEQLLRFAPKGERPFWERFERAYSASRIEGAADVDGPAGRRHGAPSGGGEGS